MTSEAGRGTTGTHHLDLSRTVWRKSSRSQGQGNNCVEVARVDDRYALRDSKNRDGGSLIIDRAGWNAFLGECRKS
ncbi:DUF397 domain-containing protein [Sphaerisporangium sp. NPDC049003]|uniref:DUF397 domain-containing protein n=1 Tax=Sphaerisporangium sp. NPDC049003 TaxID=3364517 RepID=UPI003719119D